MPSANPAPCTRTLFTDRSDRTHPVVPGFAASIFPPTPPRPSMGYPNARTSDAASYMTQVHQRVQLAEALLDTLAPNTRSTNLLIVGAGDGAECVALAQRHPNATITGINLTPDNTIAPEVIAGAHAALPGADRPEQRAAIIQDDIQTSALPSESFDRVYSWQTLEHIINPPAALAHIRRVLRPGAVAFIEYNPFFSVDGAHWIAATDIPWAHARLTDEDFAQALDLLGSNPTHSPARFVREAINRMSLSDLERHIDEAGFDTLALLPRIRTEDLLTLDRETLDAVQHLHPNATLTDLASRIVRVVLRNPHQ